MASPLRDAMDMSLSKLQEMAKDCSPAGRKELDMTERLNDSQPEGGE